MLLDVRYKELLKPYEDLKSALQFRTTLDIEGSDSLIGQDRAKAAMKFGVSIKEKGYNIYISGDSGSGRTYYAKNYLGKISSTYSVPNDWCYVYNFDNKYKPVALSFPPGLGKVFKQDMEYLVSEAIDKIPISFSSQEYERQKNAILEDYHDMKNRLVDELNFIAESRSLQLKATNNGFVFIPMIEGKPMSEGEYDNIDTASKDNILKGVAEIRIKAMDILRRLKSAEKVTDKKVKMLEYQVGLSIVEDIIANIKTRYMSNEKVQKYFNQVKEDILKNIGVFINGIDIYSISKEEDEILCRYKVNLLVDNGDTSGAPVIYESNPTFNNLMGNIEYESKLGTITTDFLNVRAGSILKANGGFLIVNVNDILKNYQSWEGLKRVLKSSEIAIEGIRSQLDLLTIISVKPEPIPVDLKVVLIGTERMFQLLYELDDEFKGLFKIKVDFDVDMENSISNIYQVARFIANYCSENNVRHLDSSAVAAVIQYCSRLAGSSKRISACMRKVIDIINESNIWCDETSDIYIRRDYVKKAIRERNKRIDLIEEKVLRQYKDEKYIISLKGEAVGQINGLSVIEIGEHSFGKPYRITASTYMGKSGIINIEREAQMSGNIHNKSVLIISGYLGGKYAKSMPLSMTAHICFEQLYGFIDGDSASVAELYAILSSLAGVPLKQGLAVTGSINQMGEVQPVGGINEKIEGFYKVCCGFGLNGKQGIILPHKNVEDIILDDDIMEDIKKGMFHIYSIDTVEDGIEILTGIKPGKRDENGEFQSGTFNYFVEQKLKENITNYNRSGEFRMRD